MGQLERWALAASALATAAMIALALITGMSSGSADALMLIGGGLTLTTLVTAYLLTRRELVLRRRVERDLVQSHLKLQSAQAQSATALNMLENFMMNAPVGLAFLDTQLRVVHINRSLAEALRLSKAPGAGCSTADMALALPPEAIADLRSALESDQPLVKRVIAENPKDGTIWQSSYSPIRDAAGQLLGVGVAVLDVTDRNLNRFHVLTEALPRMIWTAKPSGEVDYYNRRWIDYTGLTLEMTREGGWTRALHPDDRPRAGDEWMESVAGGNSFTAELRVKEEVTGKYRWHLVTAMPVLDAGQREVTQWVGTLTDIHDRKLHAETLERVVKERTTALSATNTALLTEIEERKRAVARELAAAAELRRSNKELEQFAYVASHDLQEPLRMIQAFGDRLHGKFSEELGERGREYIKRMLSSAERMRALIDDLLSLSRVTTKARAFVPVDLNRVAAEVLADFEMRIGQTGARVRIEPLPTLEADPFQLRQLLQNLIGNALKFHRSDAPPEVVVAAEAVPATPESLPEQLRWRMTVADNGIGFDEAYLDRVFQIFQRLHGRSEYEGTGIGLAICRKIVERHHGTITARSRPGEGAAFIVVLPAQQQNPIA